VEAATSLPNKFVSAAARMRTKCHRVDVHPRIDLTCESGLPYGYGFGRDSMLGKFGVNPTLPSQLEAGSKSAHTPLP
jgi:hypothetical protein